MVPEGSKMLINSGKYHSFYRVFLFSINALSKVNSTVSTLAKPISSLSRASLKSTRNTRTKHFCLSRWIGFFTYLFRSVDHVRKGGTDAKFLAPDSSYAESEPSFRKALTTILRPQNLRRSVDAILAKLRGTKKLDLFECARVDHKVPIEEATKTLSGFIDEGKFDFIGMSECKAETLRRAHAVGFRRKSVNSLY